jgi:predicted TPR repeat methyltransferase
MPDIYNNQTYLRNNPTWGSEDAAMKVQAITSLLKKHDIAFSTVAEAGCGSGEILVVLEKQFPATTMLTGFDISGDALNIAGTKKTEKLQFELLDFASCDRPGLYFDLLLVIDVLEHIPDYFSFLRGILPKSRYTIFHIPLDLSAWSIFREKMLIESKDRVGHIHAFTEDFILNMLKEHGFAIMDKIYTPPTFEHHSAKQKIINLFRQSLFALNKRFASKSIGGYSIIIWFP